MICQPCRDAADRQPEPGEDAITAELAQVELHSRCPGTTSCTCQHRVTRAEVDV
jgi:hypothetical protein